MTFSVLNKVLSNVIQNKKTIPVFQVIWQLLLNYQYGLDKLFKIEIGTILCVGSNLGT